MPHQELLYQEMVTALDDAVEVEEFIDKAEGIFEVALMLNGIELFLLPNEAAWLAGALTDIGAAVESARVAHEAEGASDV